ncbi:hypothetical protein [Tamlana flava]|uniref:hypothetical protein n=1 Tax=Tamlana flava TaxID=3158572 RepID=UPI00351B43F0
MTKHNFKLAKTSYVLFSTLIALVLVVSCNNKGKKPTGNPEAVASVSIEEKLQDYFKLKSTYTAYFNRNDVSPVKNGLSDSLDILGEKLKNVLQTCNTLKNLKESHINLQTLDSAFIDRELEGLILNKDSLSYLYTSKLLVQAFGIDTDSLNASSLPYLFEVAFAFDANIIDYAVFDLKSTNKYQAYGMLGAGTQDMAPLYPDFMATLVIQGDCIYIISKDYEMTTPLPECKEAADLFMGIYEQFNGFEDAGEKQENYLKCFNENFKNSDAYHTLKTQLQDLVKQLENNIL